eukprot:SAG31_NODE_7649_length_1630_cov_1.327237_1_plen_325_part_00
MPIWSSNRVDQVYYNSDTHGHVLATYIPRADLAQRVGNRTPRRRWVPRGLGQSAVAIPVGDWQECTPGPTPQPPGTAQTARVIAHNHNVLSTTALRHFNLPAKISARTDVWIPNQTTDEKTRASATARTLRSPRSAIIVTAATAAPAEMKPPRTADLHFTADALLAAKAELAALREKLGIAQSTDGDGGIKSLRQPHGSPATSLPYGKPGVSLEMPRLRTGDVSLRRDSMGPPATGKSSNLENRLLTPATSIASSAIDAYAAELADTQFKPTLQKFLQKPPSPRIGLTRGGHQRLLMPQQRHVTDVTHAARQVGYNRLGHGHCP